MINVDLPVEQVLPFIVQMISSHLISDFGLRVHRVSVGESERFPALAREYYEVGVRTLHQQLVNYLKLRIVKGELNIEDVDLAADQLIKLASASVHDRAVFMGVDSVDTDLLQRVNRGAVQMFMTSYGAMSNVAAGCNA